MRQIRFRAKRADDGAWVYGDLAHTQKICNAEEKARTGNVSIGVIRISNYDVDETTIGQSTGLRDENGTEIYEGDIVDWTFFYTVCSGGGAVEYDTIVGGVIEWKQGGFILRVTENDFEGAGSYGLSDLNTDTESDVRVIGNIYDNKDLADGQENKENA